MRHAAGSVNIPFEQLHARLAEVKQMAYSDSAANQEDGVQQPLVVLCRRGNDSQVSACSFVLDRWLAA